MQRNVDLAGCVDAFLAACLAIDCSSVVEAGSRTASAKSTKGKEAVSNLGLSKDQVKSLVLLPFSSSLGLDEVFLSQKAVAGHEDLLWATKVSLHLERNLLYISFDIKDAPSDESKTSQLQ